MGTWTAADVSAFLGSPGNAGIEALAEAHLPIIEQLARGYTRGKGFTDDGAEDDVAAVIVSAAARSVANPTRIASSIVGGIQTQYGGSGTFTGWTILERAVLDRYRKKAM